MLIEVFCLPPKFCNQGTSHQRPQQPPEAENGHGEGPDERNLRLVQGHAVSVQTRFVHQLLYKLQLLCSVSLVT